VEQPLDGRGDQYTYNDDADVGLGHREQAIGVYWRRRRWTLIEVAISSVTEQGARKPLL
jgi:hypothetical protein